MFVRAVVSALRQARCVFRSCEQERVVAVRSLNSCAWASVALSWPFVAAGAASVSRSVYRKRAMAEVMVDHSHSRSFFLLTSTRGYRRCRQQHPVLPCALFSQPRGARDHRGPGPASGGGAGRLSAESSAKILSKPKRTESRPAWPPCASRGAIARVQKRALFYVVLREPHPVHHDRQ